MRNRFTLPAVLLCLAAAFPARAEPIPVAGYDITDATPSGFGGWSHTYTGAITLTGSAADYTGGGGTLNDGIFGATLDTTQLFLQGLVNGIPVRPVIVLKLGAAATVQQIRISGGDLGGNFFPGQITGVTVEIGGQSVAIATIPDGPLSDVGVPIDDIVQLIGTGLELIPTDNVILRDVIVPDITGNQFSIAEIGVDGVSTAPPPGKRLDFVSDATWRVTGSDGARLGFAQTVCLNEVSPCAPATTYYNYPIAGWPINTVEIPGANWIWAPRVEASTAPASLSRYTFSRNFMIGRPTLGEMFIQADDYAQITVNGKVVGEIGSITDIGLAGQAQAGQSFDITSFLKPGRNVITVTGQNGPYTFGSDDPNADYSENPGGVVFGGRIFSVSWASAAIDLLNAALDHVRSLADRQFRNPHMRRAFAQKLAATIQLVDLREFDEAVEKLLNDLLQKTNGCGRTGTPDRNDWIIDCAAQAQIEALLRQAIAVLGDPGANR